MSGKRSRNGEQLAGRVRSEGRALDEQEQADRIAAAEAMSCLSSVILLSSDMDKTVSKTTNACQKGQKRVRNSQKSATDKTGLESKRGKSRGGRARGRGASSANQRRETDSISHVQLNMNSSSTNAHEDNMLAKGSDVPNQVISDVATSTNKSPTPATITVANIPTSLQLAIIAAARDKKRNSDQLVLKLPLVINNDHTDSKPRVTSSPVVSPSSVVSTDSVEFTQSTVDKLLQQPNKFDSMDSALPLKKRKLLSYADNNTTEKSPVTMATSHPSANVVDLCKEETDRDNEEHTGMQKFKGDKPAVPVSQASLPPVSVDPRTSLMLLNEMQLALQQDEDGDLPLHIAVAQENIVMVQKFVHLMSISGKSVDKYNKAQQTPLHLAVELKFVDAIRILLLAKANPNLVNKRGENSVHLAVKVQSLDCLQVMLQHAQFKPDLNTRNFEGLSPLHTAVEKNNLPIVELLLRAGADINILDGKSGKTPLFYAVEHNFLELVEFFQGKGANIDLANYAGITVVMAAQARGFQDAATILLKGMDAQALYNEIKESTPTKKVPIPRIPSKSHLIVPNENSNSSGKNLKVTNQNSDSNDSLPSKPGTGAIVQRLLDEPMDITPDMIKIEQNSEESLTGLRGFLLENQVLSKTCNGFERGSFPAFQLSQIAVTAQQPVSSVVEPHAAENIPHSNDSSPHPQEHSPCPRESSPHRTSINKKVTKANSSGKTHSERGTSGVKSQSAGSSKGSSTSSQMYHLTNISRSTASILAAKLHGIYTAKAGGTSRPLNLSKDIPSPVIKEET